MNRKILALAGIFLAIPMWLSAQGVKLNIANLLEISNSSISNISNILRTNGFTLQYTKDYPNYLIAEKNINVQEVVWGYGVTYKKDDMWSYLPIHRNDIATIYIFFEKGKTTPFVVTYAFNNMTIYNSFFENLNRLGYQKVDEEIQTEKINITYENIQTKKIIILSEKTTLSGTFKYSFKILVFSDCL